MKTTNNYQRGLPFQAPPAAGPARRPWELLKTVVAPLLFLGLGLGLAFLLFGKNSSADPVVALNPPTAAAEETSPVAVAKEKIAEPRKPSDEPITPATAKKEDTLKNRTPSTLKLEAQTRDHLLEALGGMCAVHLYQSYLNIGLLADAVENEAYSGSDAAGILLTIQELVTMVENHVTLVGRLDLETDDLHTLTRIRLVSNLLRTQGAALMGYWATADEEYANRYQTARGATWGELQEMLGLQDE
jgi:hypothetical protein